MSSAIRIPVGCQSTSERSPGAVRKEEMTMADHLKLLLLVLPALALAACAHVYEKPYRLAHGTGTWERAQSCPLEGQPCACYRAPTAKPCAGGEPCPLFRTEIDNDPCSKDALQL